MLACRSQVVHKEHLSATLFHKFGKCTQTSLIYTTMLSDPDHHFDVISVVARSGKCGLCQSYVWSAGRARPSPTSVVRTLPWD